LEEQHPADTLISGGKNLVALSQYQLVWLIPKIAATNAQIKEN
jgi:hypothetical protein